MPGLIEDSRQELPPQIVPLTLFGHYLNHYQVPEWVHQQVYLNPYPKEWVRTPPCLKTAEGD